jgi:phosphatidylglycerol:prolipoprotein diacylglycerol transferase
MHPVLLRLGGHEITSYGAALALAFAVGIALAWRRARARGLDPDGVLDVSIVILVSSLAGARGLWVLTHPQQPALGLGGMSMLGGVALAAIAAPGWLAWRRMPALAWADVLAPSVALGEAITRIGCFLAGCCFGRACEAAWCVHFPAGSPAAAALGEGVAVHPAQLYTAAVSLALFAALARLARAGPPAGTVFAALLAGLGAERLLLELVRHPDPEPTLWIVRGSQLLALVLLATGGAGLVVLRRR